MITAAGGTAADVPRLLIVQNWTEEVLRLLPAS
jgi:hypothetical protein